MKVKKENNVLPLFEKLPPLVRIVWTRGGVVEACPAVVESEIRRLKLSDYKAGDVIKSAFCVFRFYKYDADNNTVTVGD